MEAESDVYSAPGIQPPSVDSLRESAARTGLTLSVEQLEEYADALKDMCPLYNIAAQLSAPGLPVKYPRTPGYRPSPIENTHNAWYWKTNIPGATEGSLYGKKVAIKDNVAVAGVPMMNGSRLIEGYMPEFDATVVTRILDAGGHIGGKASCEDMCMSANSCTNAKGITRNPIDPNRSAGGSSSGCAALLSLGEVDLAVGGDQGGSIRIPAACCGVVGLKPTFGLVPYTGAMSIEPSIDHLGPMARNVKDVALLLEVLAGADNLDFRQPSAIVAEKYSAQLNKEISGMKIGLLDEGFSNCDEAVCEVVRKSAQQLKEKTGITLENVSIPQHFLANNMLQMLILDGQWNNIFINEGAGCGYRGFYPASMCEHTRRALKVNPDDASPVVKASMLIGDYVKANYGNQFYYKAHNQCPVITKAYDDVLDKYDVLIMPTIPHVAPEFPKKDLPLKEFMKAIYGMGRNTSAFNYTGHPAISVPAGRIENLPVGAMIVGKKFDESKVLRVAYALEQALK